jgi:hypothetical protein
MCLQLKLIGNGLLKYSIENLIILFTYQRLLYSKLFRDHCLAAGLHATIRKVAGSIPIGFLQLA